jgi:hypothetical protein
MDEDDDISVFDNVLTIIIPNNKLYIVNKSEDAFWTLKEPFHNKLVKNIIKVFGNIQFSSGFYSTCANINIILNYKNYKYAVSFLNSDYTNNNERYAINAFYDAIGINLNYLK